MGHVEVGGSCRGGVGWGGVCHVGVGWGGGHAGVGGAGVWWGGSCRGGVDHTFNGISLCKKMQPQKKGPGILWGQSYVLPMTWGVEALGAPFR